MTCEVKSITPIGVFVEVFCYITSHVVFRFVEIFYRFKSIITLNLQLEGVAALIHHSEVSWNKNIDASSLLSIGEVSFFNQ